MEKAYKYRIYPNKQQKQLIHKTFGCSRFVYNHFLALQNSLPSYSNYNEMSKNLTSLKKELTWLTEVDATALQSSLRDLDTAFKNMFRDPKKFGHPKFKSKRDGYKSYKAKNNGSTIVFYGKHIKLPKLGLVRTKNKLVPTGTILNATVSVTPSGKYYVSLCCKDISLTTYEKHNNHVGIDLGLADFAILSNGDKMSNPKYLVKSQRKLARLQRQLSRKQKGSKNREKAKLKVVRLHEHVTNQRTDFQQKLSTELIRNYDVISLESLRVKNMVKNHNLAKAIYDAAWCSFILMLQYKANFYDRIISLINTWFPSSQMCSCCGFVFKGTKDLRVRNWVCPNCGSKHDRDINASINIDNEGLRLLAV